MRVNLDLPEPATYEAEELLMWPTHASSDVKAVIVIVCCLAAVIGAAILFVRFVGM